MGQHRKRKPVKTEPRTRLRRLVRRVLLGCLLLLSVLVLLLALAPAIICSQAVQFRLTQSVTGLLGRTLILEDLDFGWSKPLSIGRVALPPGAGEGDLPLAEITGFSIPLSLIRLASGPPYPLTVDVQHLELNLVRAENGEFNTFTISSHAEPGVETAAEAPILPLSNIHFRIHQMDLLYIDHMSGVTAAWEAGELIANWPGPGQPLSLDLNGKMLLGENSLPVELRAVLDSWIDANRKLTPGSARITMESGDLEKGGIQLGGEVQDGGEVFARVRVPLAEVERMRQGLPLPDDIPQLTGDLDFQFNGHHAAGFRDWRIKAALAAHELTILTAKESQQVDAMAVTNSIALTGGIEIETDLVGLFPAEGSDPAEHEMRGSGRVTTAIQVLEVAAGEQGLVAEGVFDRRRFELVMKHGSIDELSYSDEASTGFEIVEDSQGLAAGELSVKSEMRVGPAGALAFKLTGADLGELLFAGEEMELMLPALSLDGALSVDVPNCEIQAKKLHFGLSGVLDGNADAAFNWTNTQWRLNSAIAVTNLSQALGLVTWAEGAGPVIPALQGQLRLATELDGSLPDGAFDILSPLPLEGVLRLQFQDILIDDESRAFRLSTLNATSQLAVSDKGRTVALELDLEADDVSIASGPPLQGVQVSAKARMREVDTLELTVERIAVSNLLTEIAARTSLSGLRAVLRPQSDTTGLPALIEELDLDAEVNLTQELGGLSNVVPGLTGQGRCSLDLDCRNAPGRRLATSLGLKIENASASWGDRLKVTDLAGAWTLTKNFRYRPSDRPPERPVRGRVTIGSIHLPMLGPSAEIRDTAILVRGIDYGLDVNITMRDLMGGSAAAVCELTREGGDPVVEAQVSITGVNGATLMPDVKFANARDGEIHAVADARLRLPGETQGTLLDALQLRARTIRIGKRAFARLLHAMDTRQQTPQFQNAIVALTLGTPVKAELTIAHSLVTFGSELRLAGGALIPLPILDHEPIGELMTIYGTDQDETRIQSTRLALLMLLEEDMNEIWDALGGKWGMTSGLGTE